MSDMKSHSQDMKIAVLETETNHISATLLDIKNAINKLDVRFDRIDLNFDRIDRRFQTMQQRMEALEDKTDRKLNKLDEKIDSGVDKLSDRSWQIMFLTVGGFATILGVLAHAMTWI